MHHSPLSFPTPILQSSSLYSPDLWCYPRLHSSSFPLPLPSVPTTDPHRQLQGKSYDCAKSIQSILCRAGCVWQCGGGDDGWDVRETNPSHHCPSFLSRLSVFSLWSSGNQHINALHCYYIIILVNKILMLHHLNNDQKGKIRVQVLLFTRLFLLVIPECVGD